MKEYNKNDRNIKKCICRCLNLLLVSCMVYANLSAQSPQGFFLDNWQPRTFVAPDYIDTVQTNNPVNVSVTINYADTVTKVSNYLFGDNANPYTTCMSDNKTLMQYMTDRNMGMLRGPGGSISDEYFWNRYNTNPPTDVPATLVGTTSTFSPWYGKSWDTWTMDVDSFYSILKQVNATGMITVNYGYARYGTSANPVAAAAHLAADWVRYDKGRTKFWEIGNETFGNWEAGFQIDTTINKDHQPQYINGTLYGQHCLVFIDSMKQAAAQIGVDIKIGAVAAEARGSSPGWNKALFAQVGDVIDFYSVHCYFTPYNGNISAIDVLNSYSNTNNITAYVWNGLKNVSKPLKPLALTEYNISAIDSMQTVSHTNGLHAVLVVGQAMKCGFGATSRWTLANGWNNGNDMGMFSTGSEPGVLQFSPRPVFYSLYYFRKYFGDVMVADTVQGSSDIVVFASKYKSGEASTIIVNKGVTAKTVRINSNDYGYGDRYYTYTIKGGTDNGDFSRKTYVNGIGPNGVAGGPLSYETLKAYSSSIGNEIKFEVPALGMVVFMAENGSKTLTADTTYVATGIVSLPENNFNVVFSPIPVKNKLNMNIQGAVFSTIEITDISARIVYSEKGTFSGNYTIPLNVPSGLYFVTLHGAKNIYTSKIVVD